MECFSVCERSLTPGPPKGVVIVASEPVRLCYLLVAYSPLGPAEPQGISGRGLQGLLRDSARFRRSLLVKQQAFRRPLYLRTTLARDSEPLPAFFSWDWNAAAMAVAAGELEPFLARLPSALAPLTGSCQLPSACSAQSLPRPPAWPGLAPAGVARHRPRGQIIF